MRVRDDTGNPTPALEATMRYQVRVCERSPFAVDRTRTDVFVLDAIDALEARLAALRQARRDGYCTPGADEAHAMAVVATGKLLRKRELETSIDPAWRKLADQIVAP